MSEHDSIRPSDLPPSTWVRRFASLIAPGGTVLDVATGFGRHARLLAGMGYRVEAVDRDPQMLASLAAVPSIATRATDLELAAWPYAPASFDGIVVTNYLYRPHFAALLNSLRPNGVLIYETFMVGNEALGRPSNPNFLLQRDELLERVSPALTVIAFEQGRIEAPKRAIVQRICAIAGSASSLPPIP